MPTNRELLEQRFGLKDSQSYQSVANFLLDQRVHPGGFEQGGSDNKEISSLLMVSDLSEADKDYVRSVTSLDPRNQRLLESIRFLLESANLTSTRRKIAERQSQVKIGLETILAAFSDDERVILAQNLNAIQLTEWCSVGCSFCGINASQEKGSGLSFDLNSLGKFSLDYRDYLKRTMNLYGPSDPFDWIEEGYSYMDLESLWGLNTKAMPYTSTAIPSGLEFSVLRHLEYLYQIDVMARDQQTPPQINVANYFRLSKSDQNKERVEHILEILRQRGVDESFLRRIDINDLTKGRIIKQGHWIKHPDRDAIKDSIGISCSDGIIFSPQSVKAEAVEAVTEVSPQGRQEWKIEPGHMRVPRFLNIMDYSYSLSKPERFDSELKSKTPRLADLLPKTKIVEVRNGKITDEVEVTSLRREALTFGLAARNLDYLNCYLSRNRKWFRKHPAVLNLILDQAKNQREQLIARGSGQKDVSPAEEDPEAEIILKEFTRRAGTSFWELAEVVKLIKLSRFIPTNLTTLEVD